MEVGVALSTTVQVTYLGEAASPIDTAAPDLGFRGPDSQKGDIASGKGPKKSPTKPESMQAVGHLAASQTGSPPGKERSCHPGWG